MTQNKKCWWTRIGDVLDHVCPITPENFKNKKEN